MTSLFLSNTVTYKPNPTPLSLHQHNRRQHFFTSKPTKIKSLPKPTFLSYLKTPLCITIFTTALFLKPQLSLSTPLPPSPPQPITTQHVITSTDDTIERSLEQQLLSNPTDTSVLKSLMEVKIKAKKIPHAMKLLNRLIILQPSELEWKLLKSHLCSTIGEVEKARAGFEEVIETDPFRVEAYHGLIMLGEEEVVRRIEEVMERCKEENRKDEVRDFKLLVAQVKVVEGKYDEALRVYEEMVRDEPKDFRPYLCQGIVYTLLRRKSEADEMFDKYRRFVPEGHPYGEYFDGNVLATKVFSEMAVRVEGRIGR